ncbi:MAG TPA: J domain-containing protein [Isosphaeraceae bacterium]|nr:J domain-containing protein [Isosphaeraceae bacterium]
MGDPYETLGVPLGASEAVVRERYLELVRAFPPDQAPEKFAAIHAAYSTLRDPIKRLERQIFSIDCADDSFEQIVADLRDRLRDARLPVETLLALADPP